ncbi:MAG: hypothetical protein ABWY78_10260 [Microvirga sp.]
MTDIDLPYLAIGLIVLLAFSFRQFNKPSFPNRETLPGDLEPLRYLFLRGAYNRALFTYSAAFCLLYLLLVLVGPRAAHILGIENVPAESWPLLMALLLVGVIPNAKWLEEIEDWLRRQVHAWFLVPGGVERTVNLLDDAKYDPPLSQLEAVHEKRRQKIKEDLRLPATSLLHLWARTVLLMASLDRRGSGQAVISAEALQPFSKDFDLIRERFKALRQEIEQAEIHPLDEEDEESLTLRVKAFLRRLYAYVSWGVRNQAASEEGVKKTLEELGFRIPEVSERRVFDLVVPAVVAVFCISTICLVLVDIVPQRLEWRALNEIGDILVGNMKFGATAAIMYGIAIVIALRARSSMIAKGFWKPKTPRCLVRIALWSGLATWLVIVMNTAMLHPDTNDALRRIITARWSSDAIPYSAFNPDVTYVLAKMETALPWLIPGCAVSLMLAARMGGDVRRVTLRDRFTDGIFLGVPLGVATVLATFLQSSLDGEPHLKEMFASGFSGLACGIVIGLLVPGAFRADVIHPFDDEQIKRLTDLKSEAYSKLGSLAEDWLYTPLDALRGVTPAEALRHQNLVNRVKNVLNDQSSVSFEERRSNPVDHVMPVIIEGGRRSR